MIKILIALILLMLLSYFIYKFRVHRGQIVKLEAWRGTVLDGRTKLSQQQKTYDIVDCSGNSHKLTVHNYYWDERLLVLVNYTDNTYKNEKIATFNNPNSIVKCVDTEGLAE